MENKDLILPEKPTLKDFQEYIKKMENIRGFSTDTMQDKCLLLTEEVGELAKAVRKQKGILVDLETSKFANIEDEVTDCFVILTTIMNRCGADFEDVFRRKEEKNKTRTWKKSC
jgi:NTP pyrophosphatase (non-canonical NTP hydrolase)